MPREHEWGFDTPDRPGVVRAMRDLVLPILVVAAVLTAGIGLYFLVAQCESPAVRITVLAAFLLVVELCVGW
jgi:hypothetical protein